MNREVEQQVMITVLGSTGSIGTQTLDIVRQQPALRIVAITAGSNIALLEQQIREFHPAYAVVAKEEDAKRLSIQVKDCNTKILAGMEGMEMVSSLPEVQVVVTAMVGMIGIRPTIAAIRAGKRIALANKETLVTAGHLIMPMAKEYGATILPVDSEHSAIFQSLQGEDPKTIDKILLTASGGPFRGKLRQELTKIRPEDALKHPNWSMGSKITIDSATMVNKGLEVIEARWLFDVEASRIQVVVHPQSIIHSMVQYVDGSVIAQLGLPDMHLPIQYALLYPHRMPMQQDKIDFFELAKLTFEKPNTETFLGLALAYQAIAVGGSMPTVYNAANEKAVALFLAGKLSFLGIADSIAEAMEQHSAINAPNVEQILDIERDTHQRVQKWAAREER